VVPEEEQEVQPYFTTVPFLVQPESSKALQIQPIAPSDSELQKQREIEIEKEKERERERDEQKKQEQQRLEKEREGELEKETEAKSKQKEEAEVPVVLPPLVVSVLSGEVKEATPAVHKICSTLRGPNGPILKFSELFAPEVRIPATKPTVKAPAKGMF
jgi:hypothetical protein